MLVLSRKQKEALIFKHQDTEIIVRVLATSQGRVKLGVTADDSGIVVREEVEEADNAPTT